MGGHPYWYFVPYEPDTAAALAKLRKREFEAGRYNPVISFLEFSEPAFSQQQPGPAHDSIDDAIEAAAEDGTRSILDIKKIAKTAAYCASCPLAATRLRELYSTDKPSRKLLERHEFFGEIDRGKCVHVVAYKDDEPHEIMFAGYSYD